MTLWSQGVADLVVVVVKPPADESTATCLRVKLEVRGREAKGKGPDMLTKGVSDAWTTILRRLEQMTKRDDNSV